MAKGFGKDTNFSVIVGWSLYSVRLFAPHVVLEFNNGYDWLNIAYRFVLTDQKGLRLSDCNLISGHWCGFGLQSLINAVITEVVVVSRNQADIYFSTKYILSIYDHPQHRSWWFDGTFPDLKESSLNDFEYDDLTDHEIQERLKPLPEKIVFSAKPLTTSFRFS